MFSRKLRLLFHLICFICVVLIGVYSVLAIENAVNQYIPVGSVACKVQYAAATITWTNPNLNAGTNPGGVYNRVGIAEETIANPNQPTSKFIEIGWAKQTNLPPNTYPNGNFIAVVYTPPNGVPYGFFIPRPQRTSHNFAIQYDPLVHHKWFVYENSQPILDPNLNTYDIATNFINGCAVVAGGEALLHYEDMGNTRFYNLRWGTISNSGIITAYYWINNLPRLHQGRYSCTVTTATDHRCGP